MHRGDQGRLLAADEGACAFLNLAVEIEAATQDVLSQEPELPGLVDGDIQAFYGQRIFGPAINPSL
jgi:hypothetical protein